MAEKKLITLEMNRVEGDLELKLEIEDNKVTNAWTVGTMYRGFEQILIGRDMMDSLVVTPRVCGICGTAHLYSAVTAIETALQAPVAKNGIRVRNICLLSEEIQSDARHALLMFTLDFCNEKYKDHPLYPKMLEAFEVLKGKYYRSAIQYTKKILEIVAIFGGQWPHSSFMVPGGVTSMGNRRNLVKSLSIAASYRQWYENEILGCSFERWLENKTPADVEKWLQESEKHANSAIGLFLRFGQDIGLSELGKGNGNMISYGVYFDPEEWKPPYKEQKTLRKGGFYNATTKQIEPLDHLKIAEHVKHSWFVDYEGGAHPWIGQTIPNYETQGEKYSWAKAPRYNGHVLETGCLPELFMDGDPLLQSYYQEQGANVFTRQLARFHRPVRSLMMLNKILLEVDTHFAEPFFIAAPKTGDGEGWGMVQAARGSLGHWAKFENGKIAQYQIITPTAWNASPRDTNGELGHWERSLIGTKFTSEQNPVELGHVIRSHDACLVCTVHFLKTDKKIRYHV